MPSEGDNASRAGTSVGDESSPGDQPSEETVPQQWQELRKQLIGLDEVKGLGIIRKAVAEFTGTFLLVFIACGACLHTSSTVVIALAFGFTVATIAQAFGHVSGAHLNPAVSFGLVPAGHCGIARATMYLVAQCGGATLGSLLLYIILPAQSIKLLGATTINDNLKFSGPLGTENVVSKYLAAIVIEFMITFMLVMLVCGVLDKLRNKDVKGYAPLAVGLAITIGHLFGVPFTGPSMNPARSFGPAVIAAIFLEQSTPLLQLWVYIIGPMSGGIVAGTLYRLIFKERETFRTDAEIQSEQA